MQDIKKLIARILVEMGKTISTSTFRRFMKDWGFRYKRMRKICQKKDEILFEVFKNELKELKKMEDNGQIALYFYDEMGINLEPCVPYGWQPIGETKGIPSEKSPNISTMGFMNRANYFFGFQTDGSTNSEVIIACFDAFVTEINSKVIEKPTIVIIDNAPTHKSKAFLEKIQEWKTKNVFVQFIPAYCPELNYIEMLWKQIKYHWMPIEAYQTKETLKKCLVNILENIGKKYRINFN